jgi:uncharacterized protein YkwD
VKLLSGLIAAALLIPAAAPRAQTPPDAGTLSKAERSLLELLNAYRAERGLPAVALSPALTLVAQTHVRDLEANPRGPGCNTHSWSAQGAWTPCCYTPDHAQAACMWDKPAELTHGAYGDAGYEVVAKSSAGITPERALKFWKGSPGHHAVVANLGVWAPTKWNAVGVGIRGKYASLWFGAQADPTPLPPP